MGFTPLGEVEDITAGFAVANPDRTTLRRVRACHCKPRPRNPRNL